jgi:hypothetical protein
LWKLFGRLNKHQVNDLARVITGDETCAYFESPRSAMWVVADGKRPTPPKQLIGAKKAMFWVYFTRIRIVDIVRFPPGEMFDQSFVLDIVLHSLKKELVQIPDSNRKKDHFCIWIMPDSIWLTMKFRQITSSGCPIQLTPQIWPWPTSGCLGI